MGSSCDFMSNVPGNNIVVGKKTSETTIFTFGPGYFEICEVSHDPAIEPRLSRKITSVLNNPQNLVCH